MNIWEMGRCLDRLDKDYIHKENIRRICVNIYFDVTAYVMLISSYGSSSKCIIYLNIRGGGG